MEKVNLLALMDSHDCKLLSKGWCPCIDPYWSYRKERWEGFKRRMSEVRERSLKRSAGRGW